MKKILLLLPLLPLFLFAQKVKINEFDKFVKQRRIEFEPLTVYTTPKAKVSIALRSVGTDYFLTISGFGWGVSTISFENQAILLLANDSTITVKSTGTQMYDISSTVPTYKHHYSISIDDIEKLARHAVVGIRKYNVQDYSDITIPEALSANTKKLGAMFISELYKGRVLLALQNINTNDINKHIGDSVRLCTKITSSSYFESAPDKPTFLNAGSGNNHLFSAVIWEEDLPKFNKFPNISYVDKEVCLTGVVQVYEGKPQIILRNRNQIAIKTPIHVEEIGNYIGDSITVVGLVHNGLYFAESENKPTVLNMGAPYPEPLLTAVINGADRKKFTAEPETFYANKNISVTGKVVLNNGKPQILVRDHNQIQIIKPDALAFASNRSSHSAKGSVAEPLINNKAEYPGGKEALMNFIKTTMRRMDDMQAGEKVTVVARFLLQKDGTATQFEIKESGGGRFDDEVLRILKKMPKWNPEIVNSKPADIYINLPVTFEYTDGNIK